MPELGINHFPKCLVHSCLQGWCPEDLACLSGKCLVDVNGGLHGIEYIQEGAAWISAFLDTS